MNFDAPTTVALAGLVICLLTGVVGYLIKVERTLARIDTSLAAFCSEAQRNSTAIWEKLTESAEHQQKIIERVGILETRVSMLPQDLRGRKPA